MFSLIGFVLLDFLLGAVDVLLVTAVLAERFRIFTTCIIQGLTGCIRCLISFSAELLCFRFFFFWCSAVSALSPFYGSRDLILRSILIIFLCPAGLLLCLFDFVSGFFFSQFFEVSACVRSEGFSVFNRFRHLLLARVPTGDLRRVKPSQLTVFSAVEDDIAVVFRHLLISPFLPFGH